MNILQQLLEGVFGGGDKKAPIAPLPLQSLAQRSAGIPLGQAMTPQDISSLPPNLREQATIYNADPQDHRVAGVDPAMFGYAPDDTVQPTPYQSPIMGAGPIRPGMTPYSPGEGPYIPRR